MRLFRLGASIALAVAMASCGDGSTTYTSNGQVQCSITSQGQVVGAAVACTLTASLDDGTGVTSIEAFANGTNVRLSGDAAALLATATYSITIHQVGALHTGSLTNTTSGMSGSISITNGAQSYLTTTNTGANQGTFTLNITKISTLTVTANGPAYDIDGTLDATVPAVTSSGATGTVILHIDFTNN